MVRLLKLGRWHVAEGLEQTLVVVPGGPLKRWPVVVEPGPPVAQEPMQREVVYPTRKYVLHGDGITGPWQWVWIPAAPPPSPPPAP